MTGIKGTATDKPLSREQKYWIRNQDRVRHTTHDKYRDHSKYMPHQGKQEIDRRLKRGK